MNLKIELEELQFLAGGDYRAIVRAKKAEGEVVRWTGPEKIETPAEFTVWVSRIAQRSRKTERPIEDIKRDAKSAVLQLCREITAILEPEPKTKN